MAKRKVRRRPSTVVEEEILEEEAIIEDEDFPEEDEEDLEPTPPPKRRRRRRKAAPVVEPDEEDDEEEAPPIPPPSKRTRKRRKVAKSADAMPDATAEDFVGSLTPAKFCETITRLMDDGITITFRKVAGKYMIYEGGSVEVVAAARKIGRRRDAAMTTAEFHAIAYSPEFIEFFPEWGKHSYEEKVKIAEDAKVEWEKHENPKVDVMRLSTAYRIGLGIDKWRPEYSTKAAREALRYQGLIADASGEPKSTAKRPAKELAPHHGHEPWDEDNGEEEEAPPAKKPTTRRRRKRK